MKTFNLSNAFKSILSFLFGVIVYGRVALYRVGIFRRRRLPGKVISVGNIAVGGTGKSPVTVAVAQLMSQRLGRGWKILILTRGYKSGLKPQEMIVYRGGKAVFGAIRPEVLADEARMQSMALADVDVVVGARRFQAALAWTKSEVSALREFGDRLLWILDDGYQHIQLMRDVDVLLLDAKAPFGSLMPRGLFRESVEACVRANVILFTKAQPGFPRSGDFSIVSVLNPKAVVERLPFDYGALRQVAGEAFAIETMRACNLVSGISRPAHLRDTFGQKYPQIEVETAVSFNDHEVFSAEQLKAKCNLSLPIITTEKDWSRCETAFCELKVPVFVLPVIVNLPEVVKDAIASTFGGDKIT